MFTHQKYAQKSCDWRRGVNYAMPCALNITGAVTASPTVGEHEALD
jgi:hypothetical protein